MSRSMLTRIGVLIIALSALAALWLVVGAPNVGGY